jgi:Fe-S-cluster containining protein
MASDQSLFECTQCGTCCKGYGGTYVSESDITAIAAFIGARVCEFKRRYCVPSGDRLVLAQQPNGFCIFFDHNCTIHAVKPRMCRQWPFIPSLLIDITNWRIMAGVCPGMRTHLDDTQLFKAIRCAMGESKISS